MDKAEALNIAHKYAYENLMLNKITNIKLFKGDVKKILPKIKIKFNGSQIGLVEGSFAEGWVSSEYSSKE